METLGGIAVALAMIYGGYRVVATGATPGEYFSFMTAFLLGYERLSSGGKDVTGREGSVVVALKLIDEPDFPHRGYMDFVDNVIDKSSGTMRGRGVRVESLRGSSTPLNDPIEPRA